MVRIRRFGIVKTANMVAALYALVVFVVFLLVIVPFTLLGVSLMPNGSGAGMVVGAGVVGVIVVGLIATVIYAIMGWILTAIACAIYNVVAGWVGGIEVQVELSNPGTPPWGYPQYAAPYGGQYGAPGGYAAPPQYGVGYGAPPASYSPPGSVPPPGTAG